MRVSTKGIAALISHEGIVPGPYRDSVGVWTYGIGHTASAGAPDPARMALGMPDDMNAALMRVFQVFRDDLDTYARAVEAAVNVPMAQHEFDAAVSFHFNTGAIARATWVKLWNAGDKAGAGAAMMNWRKPAEILPRRKSERDLFLHGTYPRQKATVWGVSDDGSVIWKPARALSQKAIMDMMQRPTARPETPKPKRSFWARFFGGGER